MINVVYGRYVPTLQITEPENSITKNVFESEIYRKEQLELTEAMQKSKKYLEDHFGFVLLYHNERLLKRLCNYDLFQKTFKQMNLIVELRSHINE